MNASVEKVGSPSATATATALRASASTRFGVATGGAQRTRIVLFGLFGVGNLGNDATLLAALCNLRRRLPGAEIACVCADLPSFAAEAGVLGLPLDPLPPKGRWRLPGALLREAYVAVATILSEPWRRRRVDRHLQGVSRFVVVGTGVLDDYGEFPWTTPGWLLRWTSGGVRAGARVDMVAVGAGPIDHAANRLFMLRAVRASRQRSYRDTASKSFLADLGIDTSRDTIVPDLAFSLPDDVLGSVAAASNPPRSVGVGVMGYYGWRNNKARGRTLYEAYIEKMADFTAWLLRQGLQVRLLIGEVRTDDKAVADLLTRLAERGFSSSHPGLVASPITGVQSLIAEIRQTDAVVASRFHNLVLAMALGRPVISVGYSQKFESLMADAQLEDYCHRIESLEVERLQGDFRRLQANHSELAEQITEVCRRHRRTLDRLYDDMFDEATAGSRTGTQGVDFGLSS